LESSRSFFGLKYTGQKTKSLGGLDGHGGRGRKGGQKWTMVRVFLEASMPFWPRKKQNSWGCAKPKKRLDQPHLGTIGLGSRRLRKTDAVVTPKNGWSSGVGRGGHGPTWEKTKGGGETCEENGGSDVGRPTKTKG